MRIPPILKCTAPVLPALLLAAELAAAADLSQAVGLMERKDYAAAEPVLRDVLSREDDAEARYLLGFLLIETYRFEEAEQQLRRAVEANPRQDHWKMVLAKSLLEQGKNLAAGEVLEQAIAIEPKPAYHHAHAMTALNAGRLEAAEASLRACLALAPGHDDTLFRLGGLLLDQGREAEGIEMLERTMAANPANLEARYRLGTGYRQAGRLDEAEDFLRAVIERVPGHVGALHNLSRVLIESGRREEAAGELEWLRAMGELRDDIDFHAFAVRKNPDNIDGRLHLADLYLRAGRTMDAQSELLATRVLAPRDPRVYRSLAETYRRLGDTVNAGRADQYAASLEGAGSG